jgi:hypothetical protein
VPERFDLPIELPKFDVVAIDELPGQPFGFAFILASEINPLCHVAAFIDDVGAIPRHDTPRSRQRHRTLSHREPTTLAGR